VTVDVDRRLEMTCVGALIDRPALATSFYERLPLDQFGPGTYQIASTVAAMIADGHPVDPVTVLGRLSEDGNLPNAGGGLFLSECIELGHLTVDVGFAIEMLARVYLRREALGALIRERQSLDSGIDMTDWMRFRQDQTERLARIDAGRTDPPTPGLSAWLTGDDVTVEWTVPRLLSRGSAVMLTAEEGVGKSTILRQIGCAAIAGIHPFEPQIPHLRYEPKRVLLVDCEVSKNQLTRSLRALWSYARTFSPGADPDLMTPISRQGGIDLSRPRDQAWLQREVRQQRADLLVIGPVYRFADSDVSTEEGVRAWQRCFEPLMAEGVTVLTEHHTPNEQAGNPRLLRPIGSSVLRRWFAQGIAMRVKNCEKHREPFCTTCRRTARVEPWRGSREDEADWPMRLVGEDDQTWWLRDWAAETA
jgi:AAA domain